MATSASHPLRAVHDVLAAVRQRLRTTCSGVGVKDICAQASNGCRVMPTAPTALLKATAPGRDAGRSQHCCQLRRMVVLLKAQVACDSGWRRLCCCLCVCSGSDVWPRNLLLQPHGVHDIHLLATVANHAVCCALASKPEPHQMRAGPFCMGTAAMQDDEPQTSPFYTRERYKKVATPAVADLSSILLGMMSTTAHAARSCRIQQHSDIHVYKTRVMQRTTPPPTARKHAPDCVRARMCCSRLGPRTVHRVNVGVAGDAVHTP